MRSGLRARQLSRADLSARADENSKKIGLRGAVPSGRRFLSDGTASKVRASVFHSPMPVFARLDKKPPIPLFNATWEASRPALTAAYADAFAAAERRNDLLDRWANLDENARTLAFAEDVRAHQQAMVILLVADDVIRRLATGILGSAPGLKGGHGPRYNNGVHFTALLRATTNCIRHAAEWDDDADRDDTDARKLHWPYSDARNKGKQPIASIEVLQIALGLGIHERIYMAPCFDVLSRVDGSWWSGKTPADFDRFSAVITQTANEILAAGSPVGPAKV